MIYISDLSYLEASPTAQVQGSQSTGWQTWRNPASHNFYTALLKHSRLGRTATATATSLALSNTNKPTATFTHSNAVAFADGTGSYSSSSSAAAVTPAVKPFG